MAVRLTKTQATATNRKKFTFSCWLKRGKLGTQENFYGSWLSGSDEIQFRFDSDDELRFLNYPTTSAGLLNTKRLFRDTSAWYHIVIAGDTTQATNTNRLKLYINGVQIPDGDFNSPGYPGQDTNFSFGTSSYSHVFGTSSATGTNDPFTGLIAHAHFTDGYTYAATDFGETDSTSGIWKPKTAPSVTYGNNGFFLKFENSGAMGTDSSGNSNTFTVSGTLTQNVDTPTNSFATINPLYYSSTGLLNGNLTATSTGNSHKNYHSSIGVDSGKWYAEMKVNSWNGSNNIMFGIVADSWDNINKTSPGDSFAGNASTGIGYGSNGQKIIANSASSYGNSFTTGDILGIALDLTNNKLYFSKNGTYQNSGVPTSGSTGTGAIDVPSGFTRLITFAHYGSQSCSMNFGQGFFGTTAVASANADGNGHGKMEYAVPTGYYTLNTKNLKEFG